MHFNPIVVRQKQRRNLKGVRDNDLLHTNELLHDCQWTF